jgi:hypothetical protein
MNVKAGPVPSRWQMSMTELLLQRLDRNVSLVYPMEEIKLELIPLDF